MNKIYIFFITFFISISVFGQIDDYYSNYNQKEVTKNKIKSIKIKEFRFGYNDNLDSIALKKTYNLNIFEFDRKGNLLMSESSLILNSEKKIIDRYLFNYSKKGNLIKETDINFKDSITGIKEFLYEKNKHKKSIKYNGKGELINKQIYHYDSKGKHKYTESYDFVSKQNTILHNKYDNVLLQQESYYELNNFDNISEVEYLDSLLNSLSLKRYTIYEYNNKNKKVKVTEYDTMHRVMSESKYSYLQNGQTEFIYHKYDIEGDISNASIRLFDKKENLIQSSNLVYLVVMGKRSKEMQKSIFHYDEFNHIIKIYKEDKLEYRFDVERNKNNNWVKALRYDKSDKLKNVYIREIEYY